MTRLNPRPVFAQPAEDQVRAWSFDVQVPQAVSRREHDRAGAVRADQGEFADSVEGGQHGVARTEGEVVDAGEARWDGLDRPRRLRRAGPGFAAGWLCRFC